MEEKNFFIKHPSLKGKKASWGNCTGEGGDDFDDSNTYWKEQINETQIDKQLLIKAIENVKSVRKDKIINQGFEDLIDELGLE